MIVFHILKKIILILKIPVFFNIKKNIKNQY